MDALQVVYIVLLVGSILSQSLFVVYVWYRRSALGAQRFLWFVLSMAFTSLTYLGLAIAPNATIGYIWAKLRLLGTATLSVHYVLFVLEYTGRELWLDPRRYLWLYVIPVVTQIGLWTNALHHTFFTAWRLESQGFLSSEISTFGNLYWIHLVYAYVLVLIGFSVLWISVSRAKGILQRQARLLFIGSIMTTLVSLPDAFHLTKAPFNPFLWSLFWSCFILPGRCSAMDCLTSSRWLMMLFSAASTIWRLCWTRKIGSQT